MEPGPPKLFWFPGVPVSGVRFPGVPVSGVRQKAPLQGLFVSEE